MKISFLVLSGILILASGAWADSTPTGAQAPSTETVKESAPAAMELAPTAEPAEQPATMTTGEITLPYTPYWAEDHGRAFMKTGGGCDGDCDTHEDCDEGEECMMPHPCTTGGHCEPL